MNNVVTVLFDVDSEAYKAFAGLRARTGNPAYLVSEAVLLTKENGQTKIVEAIDTGLNTDDDTATGMLVGSLAGIIGGPLGVLLGAGVGALAGSVVDTADAREDVSLIELVASKLYDGETVIIALVQENPVGAFDTLFDDYGCTIVREDVAIIADEVEQAREAEKELERQARANMRAQKKADHKAKVDERKAAIDARFEELKAKREADRAEFGEAAADAVAEASHAKDKVFGN